MMVDEGPSGNETETIEADPHPREAARLASLRSLELLDSAPERRFERLTELARTVFGTPIATISLIDENRQWFLSRCGLDVSETGRDVALCSHALHERRELVIEDTHRDERFARNPLVLGAPFVRFYAGAVLRDVEGLPLGTLCIIASEPRPFGTFERHVLRQLASLAEEEILSKVLSVPVRAASPLTLPSDPLTRVDSAERFVAALDRRLAERDPARTLLALVTVPGLDLLNGIFGRRAVDEMLLELVERLIGVGERHGVHAIGRLGGRRFGLFVDERTIETEAGDGAHASAAAPPSAPSSAQALRDALRSVLSAPFVTSGGDVIPDIATGVAAGTDEAHCADTLIERCRSAVDAAPFRRGALVVCHDEARRLELERRLRLAADLREAIDRDELRLVFQPKVLCRDASIDGLECLLRWRHPVFGEVSPLDVVAAAAEVNLLVALDHWVIDTALAQLADWRAAGLETGTVSVNVTAPTLLSADLLDRLAERLRHYRLDAASLDIEVLESSLFDDFERIVAALDGIRRLGVKLSLDDFGTGYSSLSYLRRLPVATLKVDRSFVDGLEDDPKQSAICAGIVSMAQDLGLSVVAEGVENERQAQLLRSYRCERAQGYHFSRPLPADGMETLLRTGGTSRARGAPALRGV